jgi:excinuclease ABC subunit C
VSLFLSGKHDDLTGQLRDRMKAAAKEQRFEDAAHLRDQIIAIDRSLERQKSINIAPIDQDVFALYREGPMLLIQALYVRAGKLTGGRQFPFKGQEFPDEELLEQFLSQYYDGGQFIPREVLLPIALGDLQVLGDWLSERKGERVHVLAPQRGDKTQLLLMAKENAEHNFREWRSRNSDTEETLARLQKRLRLSRLPKRIECYDNSHLQGTLAVGSRVTFSEGEPDKSRYRHYKVRTANGNDDFQMMYEVLTRRLSRGVAENDLPDLILIDGGKGQLNVAQLVLKEQHLSERVDLCSLAKSRVVDDEELFAARQGFSPEDFKVEGQAREAEPAGAVVPAEPGHDENLRRGAGVSRGRGRYRKGGEIERSPERVFLPGQKNPIVLRANSAELFLLQRLRDEAHRFAITFQRQLRRATNFRSVLREIPGIGDTRQRTLLRHFGSLRRIREASVEEIAQVEGFPQKVAEEVWRFFHTQPETKPTDTAQEAEELALSDAGLDTLEMEEPEEDVENTAVLHEVEAEVEQAQGSAEEAPT